MHTRSLVAYVHVADVEASIGFYAHLGFSVANQVGDAGRPPNWAWLSSGGADLMIARASGPIDAGQQAVMFYVYVDDVRAARDELVALGHAPGPIAHPFYLPKGEFRLHDPDGYVLMIAQRD